MHNKRVSLARTILLGCAAAAALTLMPGCANVALSNLTPGSLPENPSQIYTFTLRATVNSSFVDRATMSAHIVIDGQSYAMTRTPIGEDIFEFEYQLPAGRQEVAYYYLVNYKIKPPGASDSGEVFTSLQRSQILHRYVLSLEDNRGPVGASVGVLGRGFTPQDVVSFDGMPVRTVFASSTSLSFFVPALPSGHNYRVALSGSAGNSPIGTFHVDPTSVSVSPASLALRSGETQSLSFTLSNPAPAGGLLLDVTTDVPESVIMPEVIVPAGGASVTIPVRGGSAGAGNLVLRGYGGADVTIPITVSGK